jgi:ABC-type branched-subunit amino acid transport system ATPase component
VRGLTLSFGGLRALDGVDLDVARGSIAGLIGPNGAGKTSLLNCISRFYQPQAGEIRLEGINLLRHAPHDLPALGVARTFQHVELFAAMSVLENVLAGTQSRVRPSMLREALLLPGARAAERRRRAEALQILDLVGLRALAGAAVRELPLGLQKRTGLARALAGRPRLLLLDEPAGGLNAVEKRELTALLRAVRAELDLTILLIEHDMDLVMALCESLTVLDFGVRIAAGPPAKVRRHPAVIAAYLGTATSDEIVEAETAQ